MENAILSLVVIRSADLERSRTFYQAVGLDLAKEKHGAGPEHYACQSGDMVFEIYPRGKREEGAAARIGFRVLSLEAVLRALAALNAEIVSPPVNSPWGRRAVVLDPDGYQVELSEQRDAG